MCLYAVYGLFGKSIFIVHQRSPCFPERISRYCEEFVDILTKIECGKLIILTGAATDDLEIMNKYVSCKIFSAVSSSSIIPT